MKMKIRYVYENYDFSSDYYGRRKLAELKKKKFSKIQNQLNEIIPCVFNEKSKNKSNDYDSHIIFERWFNFLVSPKYIIANICNDLVKSNFINGVDKIINFEVGYFSEGDSSESKFEVQMKYIRKKRSGYDKNKEYYNKELPISR